MALIELVDVSKTFRTDARNAELVTALDHVSLSIEAGSIFGIIDYSGAGKSTLLRVVNALETVTDGRVLVDGADLKTLDEARVRALRSGIGMIFQQFNLLHYKTVFANIAFPLKLAGMKSDHIRARVSELLAFVGLADKANAYPEQLSGGQKQRVGIARALATKPRILLADEATSALDPETTAEVLDLLRRANAEYDVTIVLITHEMSIVKHLATHVAVMEHGRIVESGRVGDIFSTPQQQITKRFVSTVLPATPTADEAAVLRERHDARIVTVSFRNRSDAETRLIAEFVSAGVGVELARGGIDQIEGESIGHLTFALKGDDRVIDRVLADTASTNLTVTEGGRDA